LPSSRWIAQCSAAVLRGAGGLPAKPPDFTLVYLPHLDYDTQRVGPDKCDWPRLVRELDTACEPLLDVAREVGARVWIVNEYVHVPVNRAVLLNRALRQARFLSVRHGPFGENLDAFESQAFAVCDHQIAHVYLRSSQDQSAVRDLMTGVPGVARIFAGPERGEIGLDNPRAGDLVAIAEPDAWFAYPFWLDDRLAPDYARTVDIHRKPGYDPCELFFDESLWWPKGRALARLIQKKLGFRTLLDVVPLDPSLVKGSHGLPARAPEDRPVMIGDGPPPSSELKQTDVRQLILQALDLADEE
jgi:hypothetical protein